MTNFNSSKNVIAGRSLLLIYVNDDMNIARRNPQGRNSGCSFHSHEWFLNVSEISSFVCVPALNCWQSDTIIDTYCFMMTSSNETGSALLALCAGNSPVTGEFPAQRTVTRSFLVYLICAWTNRSVNNRKAGNLRRHRAHYDVNVMSWFCNIVVNR